MRSRLIIIGGGLAGSLTALALSGRRPDVDLLLVEQDASLGGNHVWSFFDGDVDSDGRALIEPMVTRQWPEHEVMFPKRRRRLSFGYNSIRSAQLDRVVRSALPPDRILRARVQEVAPDSVLLESGETIVASGIIDARGASSLPGIELAWQKFVGRTFRASRPHRHSFPVIMDATVPQEDGYRFVYTLPFSDHDLMVEDTYYSDTPELDVPTIRERIADYLAGRLDGSAEMIAEETGVLPIVLDGAAESLWPDRDPLPRLGLRGGFFHPTTGYSLPDAVANALLITRQRNLSTAALHDVLRQRAISLWKERSFFRLLNRMLFRAARPGERYRVLEHFYRLPESTIGRFYASSLTRLDKLRIMSGRPPVPIARAIAAMRSKAA